MNLANGGNSNNIKNLKTIDYKENTDVFIKNDAVVIVMAKDGTVNPITIAWKTIGQLWSKPVITIAVHPGRYSFQLLENGVQAFTVNVGGVVDEKTLYCGTNSGQDVDKIKGAKIELIGDTITKVPIIKGARLSYECKIIHKTDSGNNAPHTLYIGEIIKAYLQD